MNMDDAVKKNMMIGALVVCLIAAGVIFYMNRPKNTAPPKQQKIWVKCTDTECGESFDVTRGEYDDFMLTYDPANPKLYPCKKCSGNTCLEAIKCPKCGNVFLNSESSSKYVRDKCPECGFSSIEEKTGIKKD
jgi:phage FluMu protein Com